MEIELWKRYNYGGDTVVYMSYCISSIYVNTFSIQSLVSCDHLGPFHDRVYNVIVVFLGHIPCLWDKITVVTFKIVLRINFIGVSSVRIKQNILDTQVKIFLSESFFFFFFENCISFELINTLVIINVQSSVHQICSF